MIAWDGSSKESKKETSAKSSNLTPIDQLKIRLANGEITIDEYLRIKAVLEE
ncbi:SHOCT domain-containing protein [Halobacillus amylolyticus]|uniref:SHOCT domain-containing protein n=1 Tax=Halobacillus amylolyticus TaxID=2932259 RepID=UPI0037C0B3EB